MGCLLTKGGKMGTISVLKRNERVEFAEYSKLSKSDDLVYVCGIISGVNYAAVELFNNELKVYVMEESFFTMIS